MLAKLQEFLSVYKTYDQEKHIEALWAARTELIEIHLKALSDDYAELMKIKKDDPLLGKIKKLFIHENEPLPIAFINLIDKLDETKWKHLRMEDDMIETFKFYLSSKPTRELDLEIIFDLLHFYFYYKFLKPSEVPQYIAHHIDFIVDVLIADLKRAHVLHGNYSKDYKRVFESIKVKQRRKTEMKQPILEAYHRIDTKGMKPHTIARKISDYIRQNKLIPPSLDTIKNYLKEENLL